MKKLTIVLLSLPLMAMAATEKIDGIKWSYTVSGGKASVRSGVTKGALGECAAIPPTTAGAISVPSTLGGFSVTTIGEEAFRDCKSLTSVTIPNGVTTIGEGAFRGCKSLTSVTIPNGVTTIGEGAFIGCGSLVSLEIPDSVIKIGDDAFCYCNEVNFRVSSNNPAYQVIDDCLVSKDGKTLVRSVAKPCGVIPNGVKIIGVGAFEDCEVLTSVMIPNGVTRIGKEAFRSCKSLTSVTIPNGVTTIGNGAFSWCESLTSVTIPNGVTTIGDCVFAGCRSLGLVDIPDSVMKIDGGAFSGCAEVVFRLSPNNPTYRVVGDCLVSKDGKTLVRSAAKTHVTIPNGVTTIGKGAFSGCELLTTVTIPNGVTTIGEEAFRDCKSLSSVKIPDSVTTIGGDAFCWCKSLTTVTIPSGVTTIGEEAFEGCESLTTVKIPDSVTTIGRGAFRWCKSLNAVYGSDVQRELLVASGVDEGVISIVTKVQAERIKRQRELENEIGKGWEKNVLCRKDLTKLFGVDFGAKKANRHITSFYNIGEIPAYDYRPEKSFLDFDRYDVMFDFNDEVFFIRAIKDCATLDDLVLLEIKVISVIERKFGAKMQTHGLTESYADITCLYHDLAFQNRKQICVCRAAVNNRGYRLIVYGVDPVVWDAINEIKRQDPDVDDSL